MKIEAEWKDIPGYEGHYQASSMGGIRSLPRMVKMFRGRLAKRNGVVLSQRIDSVGYNRVTLSKSSIYEYCSVHRLVASAFLGYSTLDVDHINGIKTDNRIDNLRYCSHRENVSLNNRKNFTRLTSKYIGVNFNKAREKWRAHIMIDKKQVYLGSFNDELSAASAYQQALEKIKLHN